MVQLAQIFIIYICVAYAKGHMFFGNDHHRVHHQFSELPQMISHLITQNLGNAQTYGQGLYRPGIPGNGNNFGSPLFQYNRPSNIFGGNLFGSPDYASHEGVFNSEESGEPLQQPNSGEEAQNIQISQVPSISSGANLDLTSNVNNENILPNGQNVDLTGQGIVGNINVDVPNIEIPQIEGIVVGLDKQPVNAISGSDLDAQAEDGTKVDLNKPGTTTNVGPIIGQLGQVGLPNSEAGNVNVEENKHDIGNVATSGQDNITVNLNSSSDSINDNNVHVNVPVDGVVTDSKLEDTIKDIFKIDGQANLNVGINEHSPNISGISSQNISNPEIKVLDVSMNKDGKLTQNESLLADNLQVDNSTSIVKDESNQDSTLKTNQVTLAGDNLDLKINKHKDVSSIVFPDQLREAKDKMQKEKNVSQLSKLNDSNGFDNGQVLYAVNIGSSIVPQNQGAYVSPTASVNDQQVYVNSPSGASVQYVPQNPSSTISNTVPSGNIMSTNGNGGSTSGGYTLVNIPQNPSSTVSNTVPSGNIMSTNGNGGSTSGGYTLVNIPQNPSSTVSNAVPSGNIMPTNANGGSTSGGYTLVNIPQNPSSTVSNTVPSGNIMTTNGNGGSTSGGYTLVNIPQNPSSTVSNAVPSGNIMTTNANGGSTSGGYTLVNGPANANSNSGQASYYPSTSSAGQSNTYYQVPSNPTQQCYYTVQLSNGQIALVPVNSGQYVQSNGQGQVIVLSNGQQYMPVQSTGQILYSNGQQLVPSNSQPMQGNNQYMTTSNGQQYVPSSSQLTQGNGQILVASNGQQYVPASAQPTQGNGQVIIQGNGQHYAPSNGQPANSQFVVLSNGQNYAPSGQVTSPWSQNTGQNNGQIYVPLSNQNAQSNVITVPSGSVVTVGNSVPLMVFKEKAESSPKPSSSGDVDQDDEKDKNETLLPSSSGDEDDDEIDQEKDEVVEELKKDTVKDKQGNDNND